MSMIICGHHAILFQRSNSTWAGWFLYIAQDVTVSGTRAEVIFRLMELAQSMPKTLEVPV